MENLQFSSVTWIRQDSPNFLALMAGLKSENPAAAVNKFMQNLFDGHKEYQNSLEPGVDQMKLLTAFQEKTGIISTRHFTLPDIPNDPNDPNGNNFAQDLIGGIAGAAMTEIGIAISFYNLILDFIALLNIKVHVKGLLMNNSDADLENIHCGYGFGDPTLLPISRTLPAAKSIMNPVDKKNYDCASFTFFGGISDHTLQGLQIATQAYLKRDNKRDSYSYGMYFQYYTALGRGVSVGYLDNHRDVEPVCFDHITNTQGVFVENGLLNSMCVYVTHARSGRHSFP